MNPQGDAAGHVTVPALDRLQQSRSVPPFVNRAVSSLFHFPVPTDTGLFLSQPLGQCFPSRSVVAVSIQSLSVPTVESERQVFSFVAQAFVLLASPSSRILSHNSQNDTSRQAFNAISHE